MLVHLFVVCLFVCLFVVCLFVCLCVCIFVCLFVLQPPNDDDDDSVPVWVIVLGAIGAFIGLVIIAIIILLVIKRWVSTGCNLLICGKFTADLNATNFLLPFMFQTEKDLFNLAILVVCNHLHFDYA